MAHQMENFFMTKISKSQAVDTGMAMVLILLLLGLYFEEMAWFKYGLIALLITMIIPMTFKYSCRLARAIKSNGLFYVQTGFIICFHAGRYSHWFCPQDNGA